MSMTTARARRGIWLLSLLYIAVVVIGVFAGVLSLGFVPFVSFIGSAPDEAWGGLLLPALIVIGSPVLAWVCLRSRWVRSRVLAGAANLAACVAILSAVAWTSLVMFGYAEDGENLWARLPRVFTVCSPLLLLAICALVISLSVSRDRSRRRNPVTPVSAAWREGDVGDPPAAEALRI